MKQNQDKQTLKTSLVEAQKDRTKSLLKTAGLTALPVAVLGGVGGLAVLASFCFENHDVRQLVSLGTGMAMGSALGEFGLFSEYIERYKDFVKDIRYASSRIREYKTQLQELR